MGSVLFDALFAIAATARGPRFPRAKVAQWPTGLVMAAAASLWLLVAGPALYLVTLAHGNGRLVVALCLGPGAVVLSAAVAVALLTARRRIARDEGHQLSAVLMAAGLAIETLGFGALLLYVVMAFFDLIFNMG